MARRREEKARVRRSRPAAGGNWRRSAGGEGEKTHHIVSLGGGADKPLEKFPAARVPHFTPEVPRRAVEAGDPRRLPFLSLSIPPLGRWCVSRATPDRGGGKGQASNRSVGQWAPPVVAGGRGRNGAGKTQVVVVAST